MQIIDDPLKSTCHLCNSLLKMAEEVNVYQVKFCPNQNCNNSKVSLPTAQDVVAITNMIKNTSLQASSIESTLQTNLSLSQQIKSFFGWS